jgi:hypothetical protein
MRRRNLGDFLFGLVFLYVGVRLLSTGRGGYRSGYGEGLHIQIGGAMLLIAAVIIFTNWYRNLTKK